MPEHESREIITWRVDYMFIGMWCRGYPMYSRESANESMNKIRVECRLVQIVETIIEEKKVKS